MALCRISADIESSDSDYCRQDCNSDGNIEDDWNQSQLQSSQPVVCCNINNSFVNSININPKEPAKLNVSCGSDISISPAVKTFLANFTTPKTPRKKKDSLSDSLSDSVHTSSKGYHSDGTHVSKLPPIGVFWDIENCQVPKGKSAVAVAQAIRNRFFNGYREAEFVIVCDVRKEHSTIIDELNDAQVNLIHVGSTSKNAADEKLRQSMRRFADIHGFPSAIILITGDINFAADINDLRHRKKIRVILLHNDCTSESLLLCASEHYRFYTLLEKLPMRGIIKAGIFPVVLAVNNLPIEYDVRRLKTRLKNLTGNCGGRVTLIEPPTAYIKFPTLTHAHRAQKRLEGECVFGNPITVGIPQRTSCGMNDNLLFNTGNDIGGFMGGYPMAPPQAWLHPTNIFGLCGNNVRNSDNSANRSSSQWFSCQHNESSVADTLPGRNEDICRRLESSLDVQSRNSGNSEQFTDLHLEPSISKFLALQGFSGDKGQQQMPINRSTARHSLDNYNNKGCSTNSVITGRDQISSNAGRKCRTPSPYTLMGKTQQQQKIYAPLPVNAMATSSLSQQSPVELNVSNLDYRFEQADLKSTLMDMFSQHVMVVHLSLHRQSDGNLTASLKVNSMEDAQLAISKLHRAKMGHKRIIISYAQTPNPHHPQYLRHQVVSLLREVPGYKLPLFKFVEMFESRYLSSVSVSELHRLKDIVTVVEDSTGRILSLNQEHRNSPSPTPPLVEAFCSAHHKVRQSCGWAELELNPLPKVSVPIADFRKNLISLVASHNDILPLASLHECYSAEISQLDLSDDGVPVEHLVTAVPTIELAISNTFIKYLKPATGNNESLDKEKSGMNESLLSQLQQFSREAVDLLRTQPQCQLSFHKFIPAYHHHFGRQCRVANYGFTKLIQLLEAIPNTVQVMGEGGKRVVTLSHRAQMRRFMIDTLRVLKVQPLKQAPLSQMSYLFEKTIGKALDASDYGLCSLNDLLAELPMSAVSVARRGSEIILSIPNRNPPQSLHAQRINEFSKEVIELLSLAQHCCILFNKFIPAYHHHFGHQCRVADFGFSKLIELFEALPNIVEIEEVGDGEKKISLTLDERIQVVDNQIRCLVGVRYPPGLPLSSLPAAFIWQYGYALKPSVYNAESLDELIPKLTSVKIVDAEFGETLVPVDESMACLLETQVRRLLMEAPGGRLRLSHLKQTFNKCFHDKLTPPQIYSLLRDSIKVDKKENGEEFVSLCGVDEEARRLYLLLKDKPSGRLPLHCLEEDYRNQYGYCLPTHGYRSVIGLLEAMGHTLRLRGKEPRKTVFLNKDLLPKKPVNDSVPNGGAPGILFDSDALNHLVDKEESVMSSPPRWPTVWCNGLSNEEFDNQVPTVNLPEMSTPPAHIAEDTSLISPCKNLLPATVHPMLVAPHPSELPIPSHICSSSTLESFVGKDSGLSFGFDKEKLFKDQPITKRKLKLAAHFHNPLDK